jgi:hypothetical protein
MMGIMGKTRTAATAAAIVLALLVQLLVPLPVAKAGATPICTAAGIVLQASDDGAPPADHDAGGHCQLCLLPRLDALPVGGNLVPVRAVMAENLALTVPPQPGQARSRVTPYAQRAPPTV